VNEPSALHPTLRTGVNAGFIVLWIALGTLAYFASTPRPNVLVAFGLVAGGVIGLLQSAAVRSQASLLKDARTAIDIRRVLMSCKPGRISIILQWVSVAGLFALWVATDGRSFTGALAGYLALTATRELFGIRAIYWLNG